MLEDPKELSLLMSAKCDIFLWETLELAVTALRVERNKKSYFIYVAKDFFKAIQRTQFSRFSNGSRLFGPLPARYFDP